METWRAKSRANPKYDMYTCGHESINKRNMQVNKVQKAQCTRQSD